MNSGEGLHDLTGKITLVKEYMVFGGKDYNMDEGVHGFGGKDNNMGE